MKREEFGIVFGMMAEYFGVAPSEGVTEIYYELLRDLSIGDFKKACQILMESRVFNGLPKVVEIKEVIYGRPEELAILAYQKLLETIKKVGPWDTVIFEDGAIGKAVEAMGGWEAVNDILLDEWKFRRKEFESLYIINLKRGNTDPVKLFGAFDRINGAMGQQGWNKPVLIPSEAKTLTEVRAQTPVYKLTEEVPADQSTEFGDQEVEANV